MATGKIKKMSVINSRYYWAISLNCDKTFQMIVRLLKAVKRFALVAPICFPNLKSNQKQRDTIRNPKCHKDTKSTNRIPLETQTWRTDWDWDTRENRKRERKVRGTSHFSYLSFPHLDQKSFLSAILRSAKERGHGSVAFMQVFLTLLVIDWTLQWIKLIWYVTDRKSPPTTESLLLRIHQLLCYHNSTLIKNVFIIINPSKQLFFFLQAKIRSGFKSFSEDTHWNQTMSGLRSSNLQ